MRYLTESVSFKEAFEDFECRESLISMSMGKLFRV